MTIILLLILAGPSQALDTMADLQQTADRVMESIPGNPVTRRLHQPKLPPIQRMRPTPMRSLMTPEVALGEALIGMP